MYGITSLMTNFPLSLKIQIKILCSCNYNLWLIYNIYFFNIILEIFPSIYILWLIYWRIYSQTPLYHYKPTVLRLNFSYVINHISQYLSMKIFIENFFSSIFMERPHPMYFSFISLNVWIKLTDQWPEKSGNSFQSASV